MTAPSGPESNTMDEQEGRNEQTELDRDARGQRSKRQRSVSPVSSPKGAKKQKRKGSLSNATVKSSPEKHDDIETKNLVVNTPLKGKVMLTTVRQSTGSSSDEVTPPCSSNATLKRRRRKTVCTTTASEQGPYSPFTVDHDRPTYQIDLSAPVSQSSLSTSTPQVDLSGPAPQVGHSTPDGLFTPTHRVEDLESAFERGHDQDEVGICSTDASALKDTMSSNAKQEGKEAKTTPVAEPTGGHTGEREESPELKEGSSTETDDSDVDLTRADDDCLFDSREDFKVWRKKAFARGQRRGKPEDVDDIKDLLKFSIAKWNAHRCDDEQRRTNYYLEMNNLSILVPEAMLDGIEICMDRLNRHCKQCKPTVL
ncbi:hypothetical protein MMC18_005961 [Xylographa bjoerkii]|nr:hypothetical protein [Xylographa bjoerkii]